MQFWSEQSWGICTANNNFNSILSTNHNVLIEQCSFAEGELIYISQDQNDVKEYNSNNNTNVWLKEREESEEAKESDYDPELYSNTCIWKVEVIWKGVSYKRTFHNKFNSVGKHPIQDNCNKCDGRSLN